MKQGDKVDILVKTFNGGKIPTQGTKDSIGWDLYAPTPMRIYSGEIGVLPLGIMTEIPFRFACIIKEKSGLALKGLGILGGVIDSDYRGEWKVILINHGKDSIDFAAGQKVAQFIIVPVASLIGVRESDILSTTERGEGGFGSTGK